jgi:hypothetical protein
MEVSILIFRFREITPQNLIYLGQQNPHFLTAQLHATMKKILTVVSLLAFSILLRAQPNTALMLTGVFDGPLLNGQPKGVELFALDTIPDLSIYGIGSANNGGGTDSVEFTFPPRRVSKGTFLFLTGDSLEFQKFFGFAADFVHAGNNSSVNINGDDALEIFKNGVVVDIFGDINVDGTGQPWEYLDGWAYRLSGTGPDGSVFQVGNWKYSGIDVFDNQTTNATAPKPFPLRTYSRVAPQKLTANNDFGSTEVNTSLTINVLSNDQIPSGSSPVVRVLVLPPHGSAATKSDGSITYQPNANFCGSDSLDYEVCAATNCDTARVLIQVKCPAGYPKYTVAKVTTNNAAGEPDSTGVKCELQGVVYGGNLRTAGLQFTLIDAANDGIGVFHSTKNFGYTVKEGDEVVVRGVIGHFRGLTQITLDTVFKLASGKPLVTPTVVTALDENTESQLVEIKRLTIVDPSKWTNTGSGFTVQVSNGTTTFDLRISALVDIFGTPVPDFAFNLVGLGGQFDSTSPFSEGYQILPRYQADIRRISSVGVPAWVAGIRVSPNPASHLMLVDVPVSAQVSLFDASGKKLRSMMLLPGNQQVELSHLPKGAYYLKFTHGIESWTTNFIKL